MESKELEVLVQKFLRGTISEVEKTRLFAWYAFPGENIEPEVLKQITSKQMLEHKMLNRIQASIGFNPAEDFLPEESNKTQKVMPLAPQTSAYSGWWKVAASILLILGLSLVGGYWLQSQKNIGALSSGYYETEVQAGRKKTIQLSDGSRLHLHGRSKVRYPKSFAEKSRREVFLTGEAYFEVASDAQKPFVVAAGNAIIQVVGTAFNVKEIPFDTSVVVAVAEGRVAVRKSAAQAAQAIYVSAGQVATISTHHEIDTIRADIRNYLGWINGRLVYKQTPLPEVVRQLEQVYGVKIRLADPGLAKKQLTATIQYRSLDEVLDLIAATWGITYKRSNGEILLGT